MRRHITHRDRDNLSAEITNLQVIDIAALGQHWIHLYGTQPPPRISRDLLTRAVAYRLQEKVLGGLRPSTRRLLKQVAEAATARRPIRATLQRRLKPGTVLLREWGGLRHQVTVLEKGVLFEGKRFGSLSEVAGRITGARWSGPLFFGLKTASEESANEPR